MSAPLQFEFEIRDAGKKFFRNWIFRNLNVHAVQHSKMAVTGQNGSGKSTLLQVIAGYESLSSGTITYKIGKEVVNRENIFRHIAIASPYLELIEEYTLKELVDFHFRFKAAAAGLNTREIIALTGLESSSNKTFKYFSSGMKQRTRLALAILSDVDMVLLDEPLSNLDKSGAKWYADLVSKYLMRKTVVVCSNHEESEYFFCDQNINIADYK